MIKKAGLLLLLLPIVLAQVEIKNNAPYFTNLEDTFIEQRPFTYLISAADDGSSFLTFNSDSNLFKVDSTSQTEGIIQFIPSSKNIGIHHVTFEVSDGELSNSEQVTFVILPQEFSTDFTIDKNTLNLLHLDSTELIITNSENDPLYLFVSSPSFLDSETIIKVEDTYYLKLTSISEGNSFGVVKINSPKTELVIPLFITLPNSADFDLINENAMTFSTGVNAEIEYTLIQENSESEKVTQVTVQLVAPDNTLVVSETEFVTFDSKLTDSISLYLPEYLAEGEYGLFITALHNGKSVTITKEIDILTKEKTSPLTFNYLIIILAFFLFLKLIKHNKIHLSKIHKIHKTHSLFLKKQKLIKNHLEKLDKKLSLLRKAYHLKTISKENYTKSVNKLRKRIGALRSKLNKIN